MLRECNNDALQYDTAKGRTMEMLHVYTMSVNRNQVELAGFQMAETHRWRNSLISSIRHLNEMSPPQQNDTFKLQRVCGMGSSIIIWSEIPNPISREKIAFNVAANRTPPAISRS
jgi:hypothetical protein